MTPGARIAAAIDILGAVEAGQGPADDIAADYFRRRRYIGGTDRAAIAGHVYAVLRHRASLDWWIERVTGSARQAAIARTANTDTPWPGSIRPPTPSEEGEQKDVDARVKPAQGEFFHAAATARSRVIAALMLIEGWRAEAVADACDGGRFRPMPLGAAEARLVQGLAGRTAQHPDMPRAVANDLPGWLLPPLESVFGKGLEREMTALNGPAPVDLRANLLKTDREEALHALMAEGVTAEPTPYSPVGLRLARRTPIGGLAAFRDGLIEVQDEASQIAALLADARPGMRVVDFCAGAGGKTLALAAAMGNRGKLVACDISARRLERATLRLRRAGAGNVERRALDSERDKWVKRHAKGFDRVFVDAPCLGTGTWRRNPDAKWRSGPQDLAELSLLQQEILRSAARLVRPGGRLLYATCSLLREEDEDQAEAFLAAAPDFALYPAARAWAETIGGASPAGTDYLRLTPARHGTDGFFLAIFERRPEPAAPPETAPKPLSAP